MTSCGSRIGFMIAYDRIGRFRGRLAQFVVAHAINTITLSGMTGQVIKQQRHVRILSVLRREGAVSLAALSQLLPEVSRVTLRRDIVELAEAGALKRRHGGAVLPDADVVSVRGVTHLVPPSRVDALARADAVILPPVSGRGGSALRRQILRRGIPFLAESAAQEGGAYLGPQNAESGRALGQLAGRAARPGPIAALAICQPELSNTKARSDGFEVGLREAADRPVEVLSVNGQGSFRVALRVTMDALQSRPDIDIAFAVNDHAAQAAIEATKRLGRALAVYAVGGESPEFVGRLAEDGPLRAVCALFPETVGAHRHRPRRRGPVGRAPRRGADAPRRRHSRDAGRPLRARCRRRLDAGRAGWRGHRPGAAARRTDRRIHAALPGT